MKDCMIPQHVIIFPPMDVYQSVLCWKAEQNWVGKIQGGVSDVSEMQREVPPTALHSLKCIAGADMKWGEQAVNLIHNGFFSPLSIQNGMFLPFYFISHTTHNNGSFNYVKTNLNSLIFASLCINFNAFLIPPHWLVNQPFKLLLPCNVFQSFLINLDLKMIYYYLCKLWNAFASSTTMGIADLSLIRMDFGDTGPIICQVLTLRSIENKRQVPPIRKL